MQNVQQAPHPPPPQSMPASPLFCTPSLLQTTKIQDVFKIICNIYFIKREENETFISMYFTYYIGHQHICLLHSPRLLHKLLKRKEI